MQSNLRDQEISHKEIRRLEAELKNKCELEQEVETLRKVTASQSKQLHLQDQTIKALEKNYQSQIHSISNNLKDAIHKHEQEKSILNSKLELAQQPTFNSPKMHQTGFTIPVTTPFSMSGESCTSALVQESSDTPEAAN